ncbi:MAG: XdhC family protein, partial [Pirellulales bacterium]|nr:XdhC family protein [Pirellulales bacterium]
MQRLLEELLLAVAAGRPVAWCRLVETRGSTPQKAGAAMLVRADGSQAGTLGGGCVEAEVKRRALAILADGNPEVVSFQLDSDYGWDDGLICGGRMQVLVVPLRESSQAPYYQALARHVASGAGCIEAVVFDPKSGLPAPACYLFDAAGQLAACQLLGRQAARGHQLPDNQPQGSQPQGILDELPPVPPVVQEHLPPLASRPRPHAVRGIA